MAADVKIFSTSWCAYCKEEKRFLDEQGVSYREVDVEADQAEADEMVRLSGQMGVPFTIITQEDGTQSGMVGYDQAWLKTELKLAA